MQETSRLFATKPAHTLFRSRGALFHEPQTPKPLGLGLEMHGFSCVSLEVSPGTQAFSRRPWAPCTGAGEGGSAKGRKVQGTETKTTLITLAAVFTWMHIPAFSGASGQGTAKPQRVAFQLPKREVEFAFHDLQYALP